jgi:hypothetical protein
MLSDSASSRVRDRALVLLCLWLLGAHSAPAQEFRGSLLVTVQDASGGRVAGASITLTLEKSAGSRNARTDASGEARIDGLPPGKYSVSVSATGFAEKASDVEVAISSELNLAIQLAPQNLQQSIQVTEHGASLASPLVEATDSTIKTVITARDLAEIPLSAHSFANISLMAPFTAPVEPSDPTKARITAVSFGGSSGLNVDLSVDGGDNNDDYIGGFLQNYSSEAMQEFVVRTAQFGAETSRTNGGSIIISTRRGTNDWHGGISFYDRQKNLNARNALDNPKPNPKQPFSRQDGIGTLGGPVRPDKLWFFTSYEFVDENASVTYSANSLAELNALAHLAAQGVIQGVRSIYVPTSVPVPFRDMLFSMRFDWTQSSHSQWFVRGSLDRNHTQNDLIQQGALPSTGAITTSNYYTFLLDHQFQFTPNWLGTLTLEASGFHHSKVRNSTINEAFEFPFTRSFLTTSGLETFGDNQFATAISAFPVRRDQEKYQFRYDAFRSAARHSVRFGVNLIHEPVLNGELTGTAESLYAPPEDPSFYLANPNEIAAVFGCNPAPPNHGDPPESCPFATYIPPSDGTFSQSVRRLGFFVEDSWRIIPSFTLNTGLRYDTTFGLFIASGHDQTQNPALAALRASRSDLVAGIPHDYRKAVAPRIGIAYAPNGSKSTVLRAGAGLFFNDLAQNGWVDAFVAVNKANLMNGAGPSALIDPNYHTPYALTASAAIEHTLTSNWRVTATYEHQQGVHQYRRYEYSGVSLFRTDNRSSYNGLAVQVQHSFSQRFQLTANYVLSHATTWGATVGELFDYVNGVSKVLNPFGPGDHGPSGEDIRHRLVLVGVLQLPWKLEVSTISQFESARPFTMTTPVDINGDGVANDRALVNGVQSTLDEFRGSPFYQVDLQISRNIALGERVALRPFGQFFNLFNRENPGNNYIPDISALPTSVNDTANATAICLNSSCTQTNPITSINQLRFPAGALGDFFGPGTTVGIPFAAQFGLKLTF